MLNNAKNRIKRALSSRLKSSRSSTSSRDDMSVDSGRRTNVSQEEEEVLAVPRSHLRIRVLTQIEQIEVRNDYERKALDLLKQ